MLPVRLLRDRRQGQWQWWLRWRAPLWIELENESLSQIGELQLVSEAVWIVRGGSVHDGGAGNRRCLAMVLALRMKRDEERDLKERKRKQRKEQNKLQRSQSVDTSDLQSDVLSLYVIIPLAMFLTQLMFEHYICIHQSLHGLCGIWLKKPKNSTDVANVFS